MENLSNEIVPVHEADFTIRRLRLKHDRKMAFAVFK